MRSSYISELRDKEETANVGKLWSVDENIELIKEVDENKNYEEIALNHKRTENAIKIRVISHIIYPKYKNNEMTLEELASYYKIEQDLIEKNINKLDNITIPKELKEPKKIDKIISDFDNRLFRLEQKLDYLISSLINKN